MPAATNKADLRAVTEKDFARLAQLLEGIDEATAYIPHDDTTIKDVVGHRAHWTEIFFDWYNDGKAGKPVYMPAKGYKWNELKRYNADLRERQADLSWEDVQKMLNDSHKKLIDFIDAHSDAELYGGPMPGGGNNKWTTGRFAEASGPSHYRSAAKYIRAVIRANA
ncbi:ClbS/DfsB family four-helix bundle protein [Cognatiyoonia sp. IB215182]|uniref:ClbS/DfsB family four-helix bundle protein n=1 Tax=Cognatiyoonia sp. IB215182 TaxID=3097353 RepID=UPI002A109E9E|nr:ClbS/DfsB family four-helix bundle protein [Cognatiyoonia sp. IB215182]MDX8353529.1 ClbS/DfsB family four-helix bundle protein [Cognatiyoonia sp. IB215182]